MQVDDDLAVEFVMSKVITRRVCAFTLLGTQQ